MAQNYHIDYSKKNRKSELLKMVESIRKNHQCDFHIDIYGTEQDDDIASLAVTMYLRSDRAKLLRELKKYHGLYTPGMEEPEVIVADLMSIIEYKGQQGMTIPNDYCKLAIISIYNDDHWFGLWVPKPEFEYCLEDLFIWLDRYYPVMNMPYDLVRKYIMAPLYNYLATIPNEIAGDELGDECDIIHWKAALD